MYTSADSIMEVKNTGDIIFLLKTRTNDQNYVLNRCNGQDIHVMNKRSLVENINSLMELADD